LAGDEIVSRRVAVLFLAATPADELTANSTRRKFPER
jgi:hypothetical protein